MGINSKLSDLDALYPFFIGIDKNNKVIDFGRSASKCFLNIKKGMSANEVFSISSSKKFTANQNPQELLDKIIIMESSTTHIFFKGEVIWISNEEIYFFAINPIIQNPDVLISYKLTYADFAKYSPIFDFFILIQAERFARKEQSQALLSLEEQNSYAKLNLQIANFCSRSSDISESLEYCKNSLEQFLNWQMRYELCQFNEINSTREDLVFTDKKISLLLTPENISYYKLDIFSNENIHLNEALKIFINTLKLTLENLITRVNQHLSLQEAQAQNAANSKMYFLGEMAAGIAHELNNPLTIIQGIANLTLSRIRNNVTSIDNLEESMIKITKTTERSAKIIKGLRAFAREASSDPMEIFDLNKVVAETLELCNSHLIHRNIKLEWDSKEEYLCMGRAVQISQVLLNLINNASDAIENTSNAWIKIVIIDKENFWHVSVKDSGHGIPEKIYQKMMSPFFTTKVPGKGTGLGLSISNSILMEHKGQFWYVKDSPHTEFKFALPIYKR